MSDDKDNVISFEQQREVILASTGLMTERKQPDSRMKITGPRQLTQEPDSGFANSLAEQWMVALNVPLKDADLSIPALLARARARKSIGLAEKITGFKIPAQLLMSLGKDQKRQPPVDPFKIPSKSFPPSATPAKDTGNQMAMDDFDGSLWASESFLNFAQTSILSVLEEGLAFPGYAFLSQQAQRPEYRRFAEILATEMTRKWIRVTTTGDNEDDKSAKVKQLTDAIDHFRLQEVIGRVVELDELFGRAHIYVDTGVTDDRDELRTSIGSGRDAASRSKIEKGALHAFRAVEPVWCYPTYYDSNDPLQKDWYEPTTWFVMGKEVHATRLLKFVGRIVPDLLKPAYSFGGLSMTQMSKPYVDIWLQTRQSVADLIQAFSVFVIKLNMGALLMEGGEELMRRLELFNKTRDNRGLMAIDKDTEDFQNVTAPLGGLDQLQAQTQEHMAAVSNIPIIKLLGIQPTGLNADSEGAIRMWYDWVKASQNKRLRRHLGTCIDFIQLHLWGEIDAAIVWDFVPLQELDEEQKSRVRQQDAQTDVSLVDTGVLSPEEVRARVAADPESPYASIDVDDVPNLHQEEEEGLDPRAGTHKGTGRPPRSPDDRGKGGGAGEEGASPPPAHEHEDDEGDDQYPDEVEPSPHDLGAHWPLESSQQNIRARGYRHQNAIGPFYQGARARQYRHENEVGPFYDRARGRETQAAGRSALSRAAFRARVLGREQAHEGRDGEFYDRADERAARHGRGEGSFYERAEARDADRQFGYRRHLQESGESERIDQFVGALFEAGENPEKFDQVLSWLHEDPSLTRFHLGEIADRYRAAGGSDEIRRYMSRGEAINAIENEFSRHAQHEDHGDPGYDQAADRGPWREEQVKRSEKGQFAKQAGGGAEKPVEKREKKPAGAGTVGERVALRKQLKGATGDKRSDICSKLADSYEKAFRQAVASGSKEKTGKLGKKLSETGRMLQAEQVMADLRGDLKTMLDSGASIKDVSRSPLVKAAVSEIRRLSKWPTVRDEKDYENANWRDARTYDFGGEKVKGTNAAVKRLIEQAKSYAKGPVKNEHRAVILIGPPAAGKSTIANPLAEKFGAAVVDADDAKTAIPEYANGVGAQAVHEESSLMTKEVLSSLLRKGSNVLLPKVGADAAGIEKLAAMLKKKGYNVDLAHAEAGEANSQRRNIGRFLETGRLVPPEYLTKVGSKPHKTYEELKKTGMFGETADFSTASRDVRTIDGAGTGLGRAVSPS